MLKEGGLEGGTAAELMGEVLEQLWEFKPSQYYCL